MVNVPGKDNLCAGFDRTTGDEGIVHRPAHNPRRSGLGYGRRVVFCIECNGLEPILDLVEKVGSARNSFVVCRAAW
jgi:hypothetical protein